MVAGLNAVDTREYTEQTFKALQDAGQVCARMGAYKPRTSPYSFQGYGKQCLPYVFELAGKYGITRDLDGGHARRAPRRDPRRRSRDGRSHAA